ncbi:MAG: RNA polymerase-binding protein DksA [Mailhella sp.]|nr:RNA polymerase-binding protein DksA [Mailhella sp.]
MKPEDLDYFRNLLSQMLVEAQHNGDSTLEEMTDSQTTYADPSDRATAESDRSFTLRIRDRERKLITKIQAALKRIDSGEYGICAECGEEISLARLKARPVTTLCVACKARQEEGEAIHGS